MKSLYITFPLIFNFLGAQEITLNELGSSNALIEKCISGDCYNGIGVKSKNDYVYFGEFVNGKANGIGALYNNDQFFLSEFNNDTRSGLQVKSSKGTSFIKYSRKTIKENLNGEFLESNYEYSKVRRFNNSRPISNSTKFYKTDAQKLDYLDDALFSHSRKSYNDFKINPLLDHIQTRSKSNYNKKYQTVLYDGFSKISDFDITYHPWDPTKYNNNRDKHHTLIAISYISKELAIYYIGDIDSKNSYTPKDWITGTGIYVTVKKNKIIDISYQDKKTRIQGLEKGRSYRNSWKTFSMHSEFDFFEYEISEQLNNDYISKITRINNNIKLPPLLNVGNFKFNDDNNNNVIEANENSEISFDIKNNGSGPAYGVNVSIKDLSNTFGVVYDENKYIGELKPQEEKKIIIPIKSSMSLETGTSNFQISILESNGFGLDINKIPSFRLETQKFEPPKLEVVDYQFISATDKIERQAVTTLKFILQNTGQGIAEEVNIKMEIPDNVFESDNKEFYAKQILPNDNVEYDFKFFTNNKYENSNLNIESIITERYNKFGSSKVMSIEIGKDVSEIIIFTPEVLIDRDPIEIERISLRSKVDKNIPKKNKVKNRYALIIGNENYSLNQTNLRKEQNVDFAINDANIFRRYAMRTLGVTEDNIYYLEDATSARMKKTITLITKILSKLGDKAELIVYYAGHGFPDKKDQSYLIPVDVSASDLDLAIKLDDFYKKLSSTKAKKITVFLDACFTGGSRNKSLEITRGLKKVPKRGELNGNLVVFSASSKVESALPYLDEKHGMFTYHLLKKLKESEGDISFGDLYDYLYQEVSLVSLKVNQLDQHPDINFSKDVQGLWKKWSFQ